MIQRLHRDNLYTTEQQLATQAGYRAALMLAAIEDGDMRRAEEHAQVYYRTQAQLCRVRILLLQDEE